MNNDKIQLSITANSAKALLMLATQQIDLLTTDNIRLKRRVQELTDQCNEINNKLHEKEQHLNVGPSYEEMENALLTEQEHNGNLTKEVDRLTAILKERDAEIATLRQLPPNVYTEEPNKEAYRIKVDPPTEADPGEEVDTEHFCKDCRHSNENGSNTVYCCLKELLYEKSAYACGSFNSRPRKKKLPEV